MDVNPCARHDPSASWRRSDRRSAGGRGRFSAAVLLSIGDRVSSGQILGQIEPRLAAGPDRATLAAEVAEAKASLKPPASRRHVPNGCSRIAQCQRDEWRTRIERS